jgi:hypothetical protein
VGLAAVFLTSAGEGTAIERPAGGPTQGRHASASLPPNPTWLPRIAQSFYDQQWIKRRACGDAKPSVTEEQETVAFGRPRCRRDSLAEDLLRWPIEGAGQRPDPQG